MCRLRNIEKYFVRYYDDERKKLLPRREMKGMQERNMLGTDQAGCWELTLRWSDITKTKDGS